MNAKHLELYAVLGEYDNLGFPLSYCLLTTASSVEDRKRTKALEAWAATLRNVYSILPRFVHTDKDMAEIGASRQIWPKAKHQLCWWHQREAVRRRLKGNLPTSVYNAQRAICEHAFINPTFKPYGRVDSNDCEGSVPGETHEQDVQENANTTPTSRDPNSIKLRIPGLSSRSNHNPEDSASATLLTNCEPDKGQLAASNRRTLTSSRPDSLGIPAECSVAGAGDSVSGLTHTGSHLGFQGIPDKCLVAGPEDSGGGWMLTVGHPSLLGAPAGHSVVGAGDGAGATMPNGGCPGLLGIPAERLVAGAGDSLGGLTLTEGRPGSLGIRIPAQDKAVRIVGPGAPTDTSKLTIRIPALSAICETGPVTKDEPDTDEETTIGRRTFCLIEHHAAVVEMMERHFCAHPLIPGYSAPTPKGIKAWAVKQIYQFCVLHDLPNLWAYLWENWYQRGRWELWARSGDPKEIQ